MNVNSITMVFAPIVLKCPSENLHEIIGNANLEQAFLGTLITNVEYS